jgi:hypothetical protein
MRQKLNENPVAQIAVVAVLLLAGGYLLLTTMGGGGSAESSESSGAAASGSEAETSTTPAAAASSISAPSERRLPRPVEEAYANGSTVVLLIYRPGGIDDHLLGDAADVLHGMSGVSLFEVPVKQIARYAPITGPLGVNQTPALVVVRSRRLNGDAPAPATVTYGFQSASDVAQAVRDADYRGPELSYAPN